MATVRTIEQIRWNVSNGISSYDDVVTLLGRYDQLLSEIKESDPYLYQKYKRKEKEMEA